MKKKKKKKKTCLEKWHVDLTTFTFTDKDYGCKDNAYPYG